MSTFLFEEFDQVSAKQWKQKIQYELKGADYNETLVWQSPEGVHVKPFYHQDDFKQGFAAIPGQPHYWQIGQHIFIDDENIASSLALDALNRGAESLVFSAEKEFEPEKVFQHFPFEKAPIFLNLSFLSEAFYNLLISFFGQRKATVYFGLDTIGNLARTGNWFHSQKEDHHIIETVFQKYPQEHLLSVDGTLYQNAGANIVQQLAYSLAHANEYLNHLACETKQSLSLTFHLAMGPNYFFEIAKIRALRKLYAALATEYGAAQNCHIVATPSKRNKTLYDYNVNLLRSTTECMSAVLGGANMVYNLPYDALYHKSNEFGERIARNQLLILKHESYFDTVSNAADGTYYIESLTQELAEKALSLLKEIEKGGGLLHQLKNGTIQKKIRESAQKEQQRFDEGQLRLLGTNYHPNKSDRMKEELELFPFVKHRPQKTLIEPIVERRIAEFTEQERLKQESWTTQF